MADNKIAIVTGASRGIGRNTVLCLAASGVDVNNAGTSSNLGFEQMTEAELDAQYDAS